MIYKKELLFILTILLTTYFCFNIQNKTDITVTPGTEIKTYGFADLAKLKYQNKNFIEINDKLYPDKNKKLEAFKTAVKGNNFVIISGDIDLSNGKINDFDHSYFDEFNEDNTPKHKDFIVNIGSDTTLIGLKNARIMYGGLLLSDVKNIIIQNISFYDAHGAPEQNPKANINAKCYIDNIRVEKATGLWIDHCSFSDGKCVDLKGNYHDGAIDIESGKNITVSYCCFTNHDKVMLLTPSDDFSNETNVYITLHHNYFNKIIQRAPRARWANIHIYNNLYENIGKDGITFSYSLGPGIGSKFIAENNFFNYNGFAVIHWFDKSNIDDKSLSILYYKGNVPDLDDKTSIYSDVDKLKNYKLHIDEEKPFKIPYSYELQNAKILKKQLTEFAGANKKLKILK